MQQLILIIHVFGAGASQSIFGSQGSDSFLVKATAILAFIFFSTSISLNYFAPKANKLDSLLAAPTLPVAPMDKMPATESVENNPQLPNK